MKKLVLKVVQRAAFVLLFVGVGCALTSAPLQAQSGRGKQSDKRPVKPVPPVSLPRPPVRPPENTAEVIRINSDLVNVVTTIIRQPDAAFVELQRADFELLEDGAPQEITNFQRDKDAPLRLVLLFDTSGSVAPRLNFERRAAARFFERVMRPQDKAALFAFGTNTEVLQDFTSHVPQLINATKHLRARGGTALYDAVFLAADYLKAAPGRHVLVLVTDGSDNLSQKSLQDALLAAQRADAVVYAIRTGDIWPSLNLADPGAKQALITLARETGGDFYFPKDGHVDETTEERALHYLDESLTRLAEQLRTQYTLGFYSTNEKRDGAFRKLEVRIKQPGYAARARAGYYAPKE